MAKLFFPKNSGRRANGRFTAAALTACLVLLAVLVGTAIGRYRTQLSSEGSVRAREFYFTSDFLDGETHTLAPDATELTFTLGNHADELRFSEVEISYEVKVEPSDGVTVVYGNTEHKFAPVSIDATDVPVADHTHSVTIKNLKPGNTYTVTATGTGGYEKTLTAKIVVPEKAAKLYQHREFTGDYVLLTVWNEGDVEQSVTISYTGIPDNTNPNMKEWATAEGTAIRKTVPIAPHTSQVYRFFGDGVTVTVTDAELNEVEKKSLS